MLEPEYYPLEIAEILGHKTLSMVKRYAHLSDGHVSNVVASMNQKIFRGRVMDNLNGYIPYSVAKGLLIERLRTTPDEVAQWLSLGKNEGV